MNYHSDDWIKEQVYRHLIEASKHFSYSHIVGIFLQGSQNYGLDYESSDVDTKLIVTPSFKNIAMNEKPDSTTFILDNDEHIDFKDIRLYIQTFRKQNLNFLEILFTDYKWVNAEYEDLWEILVKNREAVAHYNPYQAVKAMKGIALEKFFAMDHRYPSKVDIIDKYGYDPKQLHHLLRVEDYLERYIAGESYENCLRPTKPMFLKDIKLNPIDVGLAWQLANAAKAHIDRIADDFCAKTPNEGNPDTDEILNEVQLAIMERSVKKDFRINGYC